MTVLRQQTPERIISTRTSGQIAAFMLGFGAITTIANNFIGGTNAADRATSLVVGGAAATAALVALVIPWSRWGPDSTLVLVPVVLLLITYGNYRHPDPYLSGITYVVLAVWVGLCQRRFTTLVIAPAIGIMYWWTFAQQPGLPSPDISAVVLAFVCVAVGEVLGALRDSLDNAQRNLIDSRERRFATLVEGSSDVTMVIDSHGLIRYLSPAAVEAFGYPPGQVEGRLLTDFLGDVVIGVEAETIHAVLAQIAPLGAFDQVAEIQIRHADGHWIDVESVARNHVDDPDIDGIVVHLRDIGVRKGLEREMLHQAFHDELTDLPNRTRFRALVAQAIDTGGPVSVVYIDLDGFKAVNDASGHAHGDELLRLVAARLVVQAQPGADVARLGGDEFAVVLRSDVEIAARDALAFVSSLEQPFAIGLNQITIAASAGIAAYSGTQSADDLIRDADTAMYHAKAEPGRRVTRFATKMRDELITRLELEATLRTALARHEFTVLYQPVVDLRTGRMTGAEALVRWQHPTDGLVGPAEFIQIAEESGLIVPLGLWVLNTACRDAAAWQIDGERPRAVAVNVSTRQFQEPGLLDDIREALYTSGLPPHLLTIEVTESLLIADTAAAARRLHAIRAMGVRLALDDFGTGYSSLSYLQSLPFDVLKIDKSFVVHATTRPSDLSLVQTINRLGHDLGLETLVEGIETAEQGQLVTNIGCDQAQGYHYSRPVPVSQLRELWTRPRIFPGRAELTP